MHAQDGRHLSLLLTLALFTAASARTAFAADPQPLPALRLPSSANAEPLGEAPSREWYGWQPLAADTASIIALSFTLASPVFEHDVPSNNAWIPAAFTFALASPMIHLVHGNLEASLASLALHTGAPALLGSIGFLIGIPVSARGDVVTGAFFDGMMIGALAGIAFATAIDAALLSYEKPSSAVVVPTFSMTGEQTTFGVAFAL